MKSGSSELVVPSVLRKGFCEVRTSRRRPRLFFSQSGGQTSYSGLWSPEPPLQQQHRKPCRQHPSSSLRKEIKDPPRKKHNGIVEDSMQPRYHGELRKSCPTAAASHPRSKPVDDFRVFQASDATPVPPPA